MPRVSKQFIEGIPTIYEEKVAQSVRQKQMEKINSESLNLITNINEDMRTHIGDILKAGVEEGKSVAAIASGLLTTGLDKGVFRSARKRAWLISRTELHRARQQAAIDIYRANDIKVVKWIGIADGRLCPSCEEMHGRLFNLEVLVESGKMPPVHPRCRCRVVPADFDLSIKVKHGKEGKVVETNIAPNPQNYLYVVKLNKSMEEVFEKSDYSSTQVELGKPLAHKVLGLLKLIDSGDLHPTEKQDDDPHVTVRYGLHTNFPAEVIRVLSGSKRVKASISGVDVFQPEGKDYDVLILRVDSPDLNLINNILSKLPNTSTHSFYQPHITIAYLKKDGGDKYRNLVTGLEGESLEFDCVLFSSKDRDKTRIDLLKAETRVKLHQRVRRGKLETVRSYMKTIPQMASELVKDKKITAEKYKVDPKNLVYSGLQSFEPMINEYMHLWTILDPSSSRHESTVTSNIHYNIPKKMSSIKFVSGGDAVGKEYHGYISAYDKDTGKKLGRVDYAYYQGETSIKMIEVDPEYQRLGLGAKLLEKLQSESETPIRVFGNFATEAGESLFKKFKSNLEKARPYIRTKKGKLEHVKGYSSKARLFDLSPQKRIDIALDAGREDVKVVNRIVHEVGAIGGRALIIGGFVRDALLGKSSKDIDVEVYGVNPEELSSILSRVGKVNAVGASFGVLKVSTPEMEEPLDVSIPRRDSKIGEGHKGILAEPDPGMTVEEAARRRDLTINAISYDPLTKEIIDPFNGLQDIKDRKLRAIDPQTFIEDPLRVLRVMQFAGRFEFSPDVDLIKLCRTVDLTSLPKERLYGEFEKLLLKSKMPSIGLRLIPALGIDKILPELKSIRGVPQDKEWHPEGGVWPHTLLVVDKAADKRKLFSDKRDKMVLMLSALLHDMGKPETTEEKDGRITSYGHDVAGAEIAKQFLERLTDENDFLERVPMLVGLHMAPTNLYAGKSGNSGVRRLARKVDIPMLIALSMSDKEGRGAPADLKAERWLLSKYKTLKLEHPETLEYKVKGRHLIPLGIEPGPEMGRLLNRIYDAQLEGKFETTEDGLDWARGEGLIKSIPVRGFVRTRKGKLEKVGPYSREGEIAFHGTSEKFLKKILVEGLRSTHETGVALFRDTKDADLRAKRAGVYFADKADRCFSIATSAAKKWHTDPVIFIAKVDPKEAESDEDWSQFVVNNFANFRGNSADELRKQVKEGGHLEELSYALDHLPDDKVLQWYKISKKTSSGVSYSEVYREMDEALTADDSWHLFGSASFPGGHPENIIAAITWKLKKGERYDKYRLRMRSFVDLLNKAKEDPEEAFNAIEKLEVSLIRNPSFEKSVSSYALFASTIGILKQRVEKSLIKANKLVVDLIKSRTNLVKIRKSRIEGKLIPYRWNDKVIWAKVLNGGVIVKGNKEEVNYGSSILVKSDIAKVTGIGKHGVTARTEANKKYQVLYKDLKFWVS